MTEALAKTHQKVTEGELVSPWTFLMWKNAKNHAVPTSLRQVIIDDLATRAGELPTNEEPLMDGYFLDFGGMIHKDEPHHHIMVDGLKIEFLTAFVDSVYFGFQKAKRRTIFRRNKPKRLWSYYKVHGAYHCLVVEPHQRDDALEQLGTVEKRQQIYNRYIEFNKDMASLIGTAL